MRRKLMALLVSVGVSAGAFAFAFASPAAAKGHGDCMKQWVPVSAQADPAKDRNGDGIICARTHRNGHLGLSIIWDEDYNNLP